MVKLMTLYILKFPQKSLKKQKNERVLVTTTLTLRMSEDFLACILLNFKQLGVKVAIFIVKSKSI